jgi:hypothetical protein
VTPAETKALLAAAEALTVGTSEAPWSWDRDDGSIEGANGGAVAYVAQHASMHTIRATGQDYSHADAALIEAAPTMIPALIALAREQMVRAEQAECERGEALTHMRNEAAAAVVNGVLLTERATAAEAERDRLRALLAALIEAANVDTDEAWARVRQTFAEARAEVAEEVDRG